MKTLNTEQEVREFREKLEKLVKEYGQDYFVIVTENKNTMAISAMAPNGSRLEPLRNLAISMYREFDDIVRIDFTKNKRI